jgi:hypothetical protein
MDHDRMYIEFDPQIEALLADNHIDIASVLRGAGLDIRLDRTAQPVNAVSSSTKDPATVLIASAAVLLAATPILREIIQSIARRPIVVKQRKLVPVEDSKGQVMVGKNNQPILHWVDVTEVSTQTNPSSDQQTVNVKGPLGIQISYESKPSNM